MARPHAKQMSKLTAGPAAAVKKWARGWCGTSQAARPPSGHNKTSVASPPTWRGETMTQFMQQHREEQQAQDHGHVDPGAGQKILGGDAENEAQGHERKQKMHPHRDAEQAPIGNDHENGSRMTGTRNESLQNP